MANAAAQMACRIECLLKEQRYEEAQELLPRYAQEVVASCNTADAETEFLRAKEFARTAVELIRSQRAHDAAQLAGLSKSRAYLPERSENRQLDLVG